MKGGNFFWPPVQDMNQAREAAHAGFIAAVAIAVVTAGMLVYKIWSSPAYDIIGIISTFIGDILPMALIAFFINRMSRTASILALVVSCGCHWSRTLTPCLVTCFDPPLVTSLTP